MKRVNLLVICMILSVILLACSNTPVDSDNMVDNDNIADSDNIVDSEHTGNSIKQESDMDNFLKTITEETAEHKGVCGADLTWYYKDNVLVIKGTGEMADYKPPHFNESIVPWNELRDNIAMVIIQDGVTYIGTYAFETLTSLSRATIPESVTTIGDAAFARCENLTTVNLSEGLQVIGERAFVGSVKLNNIVIPSSVVEIKDEAFRDIKTESLKFAGDAPEITLYNEIDKSNTGQILGLEEESIIYYSGSGFDKYIESSNIGEFNYTWIKE